MSRIMTDRDYTFGDYLNGSMLLLNAALYLRARRRDEEDREAFLLLERKQRDVQDAMEAQFRADREIDSHRSWWKSLARIVTQ